jgi:uncharacterized protein
MLVRARQVNFPISSEDWTSGILLTPSSPRSNLGIIIAHGAGNDMNEPRIAAFSENLSRAGYVTLRFNFLYKERGRKAPDRAEVLMAAWSGAYKFFVDTIENESMAVIAAGKSMGGRIASEMAAKGTLPVRRLIFLGYPLHTPAKPDVLRDKHLMNIKVPMLFFAGTRDSLCNLDKLKSVLGRLHTDWELSIIEGGDHSFRLPKKADIEDAEIDRWIADKAIEWFAE